MWLIRSQPRILFKGLFGCCISAVIWILHGIYIADNTPVAVPVHQKLQLTLNLSRDVKSKAVIFKHNVQNLQTQLEGMINKGVLFIRNQEEQEEILRKRKEHLTKYCEKKPEAKRPFNATLVRRHHWFLDKPPVMYCPVPKSGSTFWRRTFEVLRRKDPKVVSPFQLTYLDFKENRVMIPLYMTEPAHASDMSHLLQSTFKYLFARNPYKRVFSAYVDKVISPNTPMWDFSRNAIKMFRSSYKNGKDICGSDVTFNEFVKYLNTLKSKRLDVHLRPVAYLCDPCTVDYDVIGKLETFQDDTQYILKKSDSYDKDVQFKDMNTEYNVDYIVYVVTQTFAVKQWWSSCTSVHTGYQRLWRQLQIQGKIEKIDVYPLTPEQSNNITVTEYLNMALDAFKRSGPAAKANKREAYLQAYSMVALKDLENLREKYIPDFDMFDYDQRPDELFKEHGNARVEFDYFDVMGLK